MIKLLFFTIIGAVIAGFTVLFIQEPGQVTISYLGYEVITSVPVLIILIIVLWLAISLLLKPLSFLRKRNYINKQDSKNTKLYAAALAALETEDVSEFNRNLRKLWFSLKSSSKNSTLVLETLTAKRHGNEHDFTKAVDKLIKDKDFSSFAYKEKVEFYRKRRDDKAALSFATDAYNLCKSGWVYCDLVELEIKTGSFEKAEKYLEEGFKQKFINKEKYRALKSIVLFMSSELPYREKDKEALLSEAHKLNPAHTVIAEKLALFYIAQNKAKKAQSILFDSFKLCPALPLYRVFVQTLTKENDVDKLKSVERLITEAPDDLKTFIMADIYMKISLWGKAFNELKKYIENHNLTPALCKMMSKIEQFSGVHYHLSECIVVESDEHTFDSWVCNECGYISINGYKAQCDNCCAIGSIDWQPAP